MDKSLILCTVMDNSPFFFLVVSITLAIAKISTQMSTLKKIGIVVKSRRTKLGLSQEQFSAHCGIDQHYLSNIENGQRNLSVDVLERISSRLGLSIKQLFEQVELLSDLGTSTVASVSSINRENFITYMEENKLSKRTVQKYSCDTPNCIAVQRIIRDVAGTTTDMYRIVDPIVLAQIIERVRECDFDAIGDRMYSCGLKKYRAYILSKQ